MLKPILPTRRGNESDFGFWILDFGLKKDGRAVFNPKSKFQIPKSDRRPAFTLIELLVVVAIIALLISILLPSLSNAREQSKELVCATRLAELYRGHQYYAQDDSKNLFPHHLEWLYFRVAGQPSDTWVEHGRIYRYVVNKDTYFCPKDNRARLRGSQSIGAGGTRGEKAIHSYVREGTVHLYFHSMEPSFDGVRDYLKPDYIVAGAFYPNQSRDDFHPAAPGHSIADRVVFMYEESQGILADQATNFVLNDGHSYAGSSNDPMTQRHRGRGLGVFWDGHSQILNARRFNNDPLYVKALVYGGLIPPE